MSKIKTRKTQIIIDIIWNLSGFRSYKFLYLIPIIELVIKYLHKEYIRVVTGIRRNSFSWSVNLKFIKNLI